MPGAGGGLTVRQHAGGESGTGCQFGQLAVGRLPPGRCRSLYN